MGRGGEGGGGGIPAVRDGVSRLCPPGGWVGGGGCSTAELVEIGSVGLSINRTGTGGWRRDGMGLEE